MPTNTEVRQPGQSTNQAQQQRHDNARDIQDQLMQEIRAIADNELEKRRLANSISNAVKDAEVSASEQRRSTQLRARGESTGSSNERTVLKRDLVRVLKAVEQGLIEVPSEGNKAILLNLNEKLGAQLSEASSPFLQPLIAKLLESNQTIQDLQTQYASLKQESGVYSPELVKKVSESIVESADAGKLSVNGDAAREMFNTQVAASRNLGSEEEQKVYQYDWDYYYRNFFGPEDEPVLEALYSVEGLGKLMTGIREDVTGRQASQQLDSEAIDKMVCAELEEKIVLTYSNMYSRIDRARADKTFEEIEQEGSLYSSIRAVEAQFKGALQLMATKVRHLGELPEELRNVKFFQRYSIEGLREKEMPFGDPTKGETKKQLQYKITPVAGSEPVSLADFLNGLSSEIEHENNIRRYLHNIQSLFLRPAGKDGFWGQVAGYSEQLKSEDIDAMMLLPDSEKLISAYRLYVKYLEEEFAKVDWIHQPNMFADDLFKNKSKVQQRVFADLKKMYPDLGSDADNWRLQRALAMGVGLARGVFLSEAEIAASADPHINVQNGAPKFTSYFTNDNAATEPLNPLHFFLRWQGESVTMGPLIYMPVDAINKKLLRKWDHTELWTKMKQYRDSFEKGKVAFGGNPKDKFMGQLFVDILPNYAKGGSFITRGGWRMTNATEGWMYDSNGHERSLIDKFKALENIGYEAVKIIDPVGGHGHAIPHSAKDPLYRYLAEKYLAGEVDGDVWTYIKDLKVKGKGDKIEHKEKLFMNTVYSRMLQQRMPTKFIRLERDRLSKTGKSLWKLVREDMGGMPAEKFDGLMKDLSYVEVAVRNDVSKEMKDFLATQSDKDKDLSGFRSTLSYVVDENAIRRHVSDPTQQQQVLWLYKSIGNVIAREKYLDVVASTLNSPTGYAFSIGAEELDTSFIAIRNAGPRVLARALNDTAQIETKVTHNLKAFMGGLHHVSIDPKHDFHPLVKNIAEMKSTLESIHGHTIASRVAQYMATMTVAYFKKDDVAHNWRSKHLTIGRANSLAAEFAGTHRGVWEWDVAEVDAFLTTLERERIIAKNGSFDLGYQALDVPTTKKKNFLGIKWHDIEHDDEGFVNGKTLRSQLGANKLDITKEIVMKYAFPAMLILFYTLMSKAFKDTNEKK